MRFKTIFLIFALAMFMLAGVALAEDDDDQGENNDNPFPCDNLVIIEAPESLYLTIATYFDNECQVFHNKEVRFETCTLEGDCDDSESESLLGRIAASQAATVPSTILICAECDSDDPEVALTDFANDYSTSDSIIGFKEKAKLEYELDKNGKAVQGTYGKYLRHPFSGVSLAEECGVPAEVCHIIATHAGEGNMVKRTTEAYVVHHADFMTFLPFKERLVI